MSGRGGWEREVNRSKVKKDNQISIGAKACSQRWLAQPSSKDALTPQLCPVIIKYQQGTRQPPFCTKMVFTGQFLSLFLMHICLPECIMKVSLKGVALTFKRWGCLMVVGFAVYGRYEC